MSAVIIYEESDLEHVVSWDYTKDAYKYQWRNSSSVADTVVKRQQVNRSTTSLDTDERAVGG